MFDGFHIQGFAVRYAPGALLTLGVLGLVAFLAAGWFIVENPTQKWMLTGGTPMT